jgi:hypothetical protein
MFVDGELRQHVQKFATRQKSDVPRGPVAKRRRVDDETPSVLLEVANQLCRLIDADPSSEIEELEAYIVFVTPACSNGGQKLTVSTETGFRRWTRSISAILSTSYPVSRALLTIP